MLSDKIQKVVDDHLLDQSHVEVVLATILVFGSTDSLLGLIPISSIQVIREHFCNPYKNGHENCDNDQPWSIQKKYLPIIGKSLWNQVVKQLKDSHGFTNQGVPPLVFDFNIYQKEPDSEQVLQRLVIEGYTIKQIAAEISNYFTRNKFVGTMGKFVSNGLESALIDSPDGTMVIKGMM